MLIFYLIGNVLSLIPDNCKWIDPDGFHFDLNHLKKKENYKITSFSGAMSFEFNFCTWGVQCNHREVAAFQLFHNKCYTIGLKSESDIWYDSFGLNLKYKNGDLCGETLQYSVQFQIQCGDETPFKQIMTDSPCNIKLQSTHPMACRTKTSYSVYYILIAIIVIIAIFLKYRKRRQEQGYVLV